MSGVCGDTGTGENCVEDEEESSPANLARIFFLGASDLAGFGVGERVGRLWITTELRRLARSLLALFTASALSMVDGLG